MGGLCHSACSEAGTLCVDVNAKNESVVKREVREKLRKGQDFFFLVRFLDRVKTVLDHKK